MADLEFRILGSLEVHRESGQLAIGGAKQRALLAVLLINANRVVTNDFLIEALWPTKRPGRPLTAIQGYVSALRKVLSDRDAEVIVTEPAGYKLALRPGALDLSRFDVLAATGRSALANDVPLEATSALTEALSLFRGTPLADFAYEDWARGEIDRIAELRLACLEDKVDADLALGRHAELVGELDAITSEHPLRERFRGQLMLALYRSGRQAEALDVYQATRAALVDELGLEPGPPIQTLHTQILNQDPVLAAPGRQAPGAPIIQLPTPASSFVGRALELDEVSALIKRDDVRLITLTGPGGTGKTRLAREVAAMVADGFSDGVIWIGLAAVRDAALVIESMSQALDAKAGIPEHIGQQELLLVIDNFEQVIEAAPQLSHVLVSCPRLTLLVTSRELLRVQGEVEYAVPPLAESEAVGLFCDRAQVEQSEEIVQLCVRLDSLPLAVELAAARTRALSPAQILERVSQSLDLLKGGRDADPRQQTLRATIEWSYELLSSQEQRLFSRLAVFAGSWTLDAAELVAEADVDTLQSLIEKSLVSFSAGRYWMLETINAYAEDQLEGPERLEMQARHADWVKSLAAEAETALEGSDSLTWLRRLDAELPNVRSAIGWASEQVHSGLELAITAPLWRYWLTRGLFAEAGASLARGLDGEHEATLRIRGLRAASWIAFMRADYGRAMDLSQERLELARALGDDVGVVGALGLLAYVSRGRGALDEARALHEEALTIASRLGDDRLLARALNQLADCLVAMGDTNNARRLLEDGLTLAEGSPSVRSFLLSTLGSALTKDGDLRGARRALMEALEYSSSAGSAWDAALDLELFAATYVAEEPGLAARLFATSEAALKPFGQVVRLSDQVDLRETAIAAIQEALSDDDFVCAWAEGSAMELEAAIHAILAEPQTA